MDMRITRYFMDRDGNRTEIGSSTYYSESGWASIAEFQHSRQQHFAKHPRECFWPHATGGLVCERFGNYGLRSVLNIELRAL